MEFMAKERLDEICIHFYTWMRIRSTRKIEQKLRKYIMHNVITVFAFQLYF